MPKELLTSEMKNHIRKNYLKVSGQKLADKFGVNKSVIYRFMKIEGLNRPKELIKKWRSEAMCGRTTFRKDEDKFIKKNYLTMPVKVMAEKIGRSGTGVTTRLRQLELTIPEDIIEQRKQDSRIKPGNIPMNKGRKQSEYMTAEAIERTKSTRFKKGHLPHNTKTDGEITIRHDHPDRPGGKPYKYVRIAQSKWEALHRHLWEKHHGPIPKGMNVVFKDGDTLNCIIENLELISNAENMKRNTIHNYPDEIKKNIRLTGKLTRKIKNYEQHH